MAAIGDILVKFVADFAEFSTNMAKSQKDIESWSKSIADAGKSVEGFIALAKRVAGALAIGEAIQQVIQFNNEMQKSGEALAAYSLRTDAASRSVRGLTDDSVKLAELYKTMGREWTEDYLARVQKAQDASEDFSNKSFVLGQRLHDLYLQLTQRPGDGGGVMDWASKEANALFDWLEKLVPSVNKVVDVLATGLVIQLKSTAEGMRLLVNATIDLWGWLAKVAAQATVSGAELEKMGRAEAAARGYKTGPAGGGPTGSGGAFGMFDGTSGTITAAEAARQFQQNQQQTARGFGNPLGVPISLAAADNPPAAAARAGGGGGGKTDEDFIQAQIDRYNGLTKAAKTAYDTINTGQGQNIEDLKRQVTVQQQVDDIVAKQIAKHQQVTEIQKQELYAAVEGYEREREAAQHLLEVNNAAVETDKKYGDGKIAMTKITKDLAEQINSQRLSTEAAARAQKDLNEQQEQAALTAKRFDDNMGSFAAGIEHAANAQARANDLFAMGEATFNSMSDAMIEGMKALSGQASKSFGEIALSFAQMIEQMAMKELAAQTVGLIMKGIGMAVGAAAGGVSPGVVSASDWAAMLSANTGGNIAGMRASGGPVGAGQPYIVGEQGPELFVPAAAGRIVPNGSTATSGGVTLNIDMSGGQGTSDPNQAIEFGRRVKQAVVGVIQNEKRPGGTLYQRLSG
jgi:hypothetical protein